MNTTGALITAAGKPDRMDEFRPMLKLTGNTLIQKEIDTLRKAGTSPIVVVTGYEGEQLERHLSHRGVVCIRNEAYESSQMFDSVKLGLSWLAGKCSQVLFLPVDAPMFSAATLSAVMQGKGDFTVPVHDGRQGHPIRIAGSVIPRILNYEGDNGLRGIMEEPGITVAAVEVQDPGVLLEVEDHSGYGQALAYEQESIAASDLSYDIRITLSKDDVFFGPGAAELLKHVDEEGSLLSACKTMNMSYSKGWKMVKAVEDSLGFPFLQRKTGGADGGNSILTEEGRDFLEKYLAFEEDIKRTADAFYHMHFADRY
ncbi:MAG: NTP transferase domain-containing protein [Lachnospiraceae bacterium]|nr:NTP transferase domain-containing protein [Lachnospiraceae bacterium]